MSPIAPYQEGMLIPMSLSQNDVAPMKSIAHTPTRRLCRSSRCLTTRLRVWQECQHCSGGRVPSSALPVVS